MRYRFFLVGALFVALFVGAGFDAEGAEVKVGSEVVVKSGVKLFKKVRGKIKKWKNKKEFTGKVLKVKKKVVLVSGPSGKVWVKKSDITLKTAQKQQTVPKKEEKTTQQQSNAPPQTTTQTAQQVKPKEEKKQAKQAVSVGKNLKPIRVAVYDLTGTGLDKKHLTLITDSLITEIRKLENVSAMGMNEIRTLLSLEEQRQMLGCSDESCLLEIAAALGADYIVLGSIGKVGDASVMTLKRLEMRTGRALHTYSKRFKGGSGEEFLTAIGEAVKTLFPERPLRKGEKRGVPPEIVSRWNPPPLKPWVFWTGVGLTAAAAVAGGVFYALQYSAAEDYNNPPTTITDDGRKEIDGAYLKDAEDRYDRWGLAKWVSFGVAGGFAVATGIIALFTDWQGDVALTPQITPSGAGVGVQGKF